MPRLLKGPEPERLLAFCAEAPIERIRPYSAPGLRVPEPAINGRQHVAEDEGKCDG